MVHEIGFKTSAFKTNEIFFFRTTIYLLLLGFLVPFRVKWMELINQDKNSIGSPLKEKV